MEYIKRADYLPSTRCVGRDSKNYSIVLTVLTFMLDIVKLNNFIQFELETLQLCVSFNVIFTI